MYHVKNDKLGALFIGGVGGTRKIILYRALFARFHQLGKIVLSTTSSGTATLTYPLVRLNTPDSKSLLIMKQRLHVILAKKLAMHSELGNHL